MLGLSYFLKLLQICDLCLIIVNYTNREVIVIICSHDLNDVIAAMLMVNPSFEEELGQPSVNIAFGYDKSTIVAHTNASLLKNKSVPDVYASFTSLSVSFLSEYSVGSVSSL